MEPRDRIWKVRVAASPKDAQVELGLASAYFQSGDAANTIAALKQVGVLDPSMAAQANQLITQIQDGTLKPGQQ